MANTSFQYQVNTGIVNIATANTNLDGTGTLGLVISGAIPSGVSNGGTVVRSITVKATQTTSQGMIRIFKFNGTNYFLLREIVVPAVTQSGILPAFSAVVRLPVTLSSSESLYAATQNAESFNVIADGMNYGSCACSESATLGYSNVQYYPFNGNVNISTANSNLDGTGAIGVILTAPSGGNNGLILNSITIKGAQATTSQGMIRLFLNNVVSNFLFYEFPIPPVANNSGVLPTLSLQIPVGFNLQGGYTLAASTQNGESFNVIAGGTAFSTCGC